MSKILVVGVVALLLFGGVLAADLALENPDNAPGQTDDATQQQEFTEASGQLVELAVPLAMFGGIGALLVGAVRAIGGA